jgi:hypothetical protein
MSSFRPRDHFRKVCALVAASLILPALAYADRDNDRVNHGRGDNNERHGNPRISAVPEANAGWVLVPFFGAVLLFSARHLFRGKVTDRNLVVACNLRLTPKPAKRPRIKSRPHGLRLEKTNAAGERRKYSDSAFCFTPLWIFRLIWNSACSATPCQ